MKYCVIGKHGLLGKALTDRLGEVSSFPTEDTEVVFNFASPVHPPFEENPDYHISETLNAMMYLLPYCRDHGIYYIYPSSALVYEKDTTFAKFKKMTEIYASCYPKTLGLRIFPVYGPGEGRTVISQWIKAIKNDERPIVYGDGTQTRDFIYIDDAIDQIITLVDNRVVGVRDIGVGKPVSFNQIIKTINLLLEKDIKPIYIDAPKDYSQGIICEDPGEQKVSITEGIRRML